MKLYNTKDNTELENKVIEYCNHQMFIREPYQGLFYEDMITDIDNNPIRFVYDEKRQIVASIVTSYRQFGQTIWHADSNEIGVISALQAEYPGTIFISVDGYSMTDKGLHATVCCASYNDHIIYPSIANAGIWTNNPDSVTTLRDWFEERHLNPAEDWQNRIEYKWVNMEHNMLYDAELMDYPWYRNDCGHYAYVGFHYFNWSHNSDHEKYLFAMVDNKPIGCICVGKYEQYGYYGLSYIDVASPYKKNGIAKKMIHELTKVIPGDLPLLLSIESEEGQKCHIHECFKREKWPNACVTQDEFDEMHRLKSK